MFISYIKENPQLPKGHINRFESYVERAEASCGVQVRSRLLKLGDGTPTSRDSTDSTANDAPKLDNAGEDADAVSE